MVARAAGAQRGKASFDDIYAAPDPRAYYEGLGSLGYEVPQHGWHVFSAALDALDVERPTVVDLCSSYGVNAALLKHDLDLDDLYRHYCAPQHADLTPDELAEIDREFFAQHLREDTPRVIGVDVAAPAIDYAVRVGLLDAGRVENLETAAPSAELGEHLAAADLITVTGGVGYITERTFDGILECAEESAAPALGRQPVPAHGLVRADLGLPRVPRIRHRAAPGGHVPPAPLRERRRARVRTFRALGARRRPGGQGGGGSVPRRRLPLPAQGRRRRPDDHGPAGRGRSRFVAPPGSGAVRSS